MAVGKRHSTDQPLTEHDVAERLTHAALRTYTILVQMREQDMMDVVKSSRYHHPELLQMLRDELEAWK